MNDKKSIKIGSRILSDKSMEILLPNYKNVYSQIKEIRQNSKILKENLKNKELKCIVEKEPEFVKHHNNVFSILGERGSGKTSVLLTIKHKIMQIIEGVRVENEVEYEGIENDIVLPIIVPQDMDEDSDSLGWIIGFFAKLVDEVEYEFQNNINIFEYKENMTCSICKNEQYSARKEKVNYVKEAFQEVKKSYFLRKDDYKKSLTDVGAKTEYVDLNAETLSKDIQLSSSFKKFIDEYIEYKMNQKRNQNIEPLIYIFFDDVDISTKKCLNVLETIIRFLSHSNIVIFVSGNYTTFEETIVINYLEQDGILNSKLLENNFSTEDDGQNKNALKIRQELAYDYLKKVLSPALRYELKKIENEDKMNFKYNSEDSREEYETLYQLIQKNFGLNDGESSFLTYESINEEKEYIPISTFFNSFEDKPRGLMNIYYYLNSMKKIIEDKRDKKENYDLKKIWTCEELNHLLDIIIDSSSKLNMYKKKIKSLIRIQNLESKNEIEVDVRYNAIIKRGIIEENLKLELVTLGMFFDGIYCSLYKDKINEYSDNFIKIKEYDEISEIKDFLNGKIFKKEDFPIEIIHRMKNPFEMLYVFGIAKKYPLNIETEKEQILILKKILKHVFSGNSEINEDVIENEQIRNYINKKNIDDTNWLENLKMISKKASQFLIFEINEDLQNLLKYYYSIDKNQIEKQNGKFFQKIETNLTLFKSKLTEVEPVDINYFNDYFNVRETILNSNELFKKPEILKMELEESVSKVIFNLKEIEANKRIIKENETSLKQNNFDLKSDREIQEKLKEKNILEQDIQNKNIQIQQNQINQIKLKQSKNEIEIEKTILIEQIRNREESLNRITKLLEQDKQQMVKLRKYNKQMETEEANQEIRLREEEKNRRARELNTLREDLDNKENDFHKYNEEIMIVDSVIVSTIEEIENIEEKIKKLGNEIKNNEDKKMNIYENEKIIKIKNEQNENIRDFIKNQIATIIKINHIPEHILIKMIEDNHKPIKDFFEEVLKLLDESNRKIELYKKSAVIADLMEQIKRQVYNRIKEYRTIKENNQIIEKLKEMLIDKDLDKKEIINYLGKVVNCEFIEENGEFIKYDFEKMDNYYMINLIILLLKKNNINPKEVKEYDMNNIEIALKKKDNELENRYGVIRISEELIERLKVMKKVGNIQFELGEIIDSNKMSINNFSKMKKEIELAFENLSNTFNEDKFMKNQLNSTLFFDLNHYEREIKSPKIKERLEYRAYAFVYAIIKKETRKKENDYEKIEDFYKDLNTILDANDIKLKEDMFKLDI